MPRTRPLPRSLRLLRLAVRRGVRRVDRRAGEWSRRAGSWGGSLFVHAIFLLILLLVVVWQPEERRAEGPVIDTAIGRLDEDVTSLNDADRAGDPFTRMENEALSLPLDPNELDPDRLNIPELPATIRFQDELRVADVLDLGRPGVASPVTMTTGIAAGFGSVGSTAPFSGRHAALRAALLRSEGGTRESEAAVERGLDWIARHQAPDGHWNLDPLAFCARTPCPAVPAIQSDAAATGLALLPLLGAGHSHLKDGRYQATIQRGLDWLVTMQAPAGEIFTGSSAFNARMYSHAIAALAVCEAFGVTGDEKLRQPAQAAVDFIAAAQSAGNGGWRYEPGMPGDTSVFGWQMMALRSAHLAHLKLNPRTVAAARAYLDSAATDRKKVMYGYLPGRSTSLVMTAEALLCRQYLGWKRETPALRTGAGRVFEHLMTSSEANIYYWYYATQMLHNMGGKSWKQWNDRIRDGLVATQSQGEGCDHGSWSPVSPVEDRWGRTAGRHFQTCLSILTLEVYYRYLPLYQDKVAEPIGSEPVVPK